MTAMENHKLECQLTVRKAYGLNAAELPQPARILCQSIVLETKDYVIALLPHVNYDFNDNTISGLSLLATLDMTTESVKEYCRSYLETAGHRSNTWDWIDLNVSDEEVCIDPINPAHRRTDKVKSITQSEGFLEFRL